MATTEEIQQQLANSFLVNYPDTVYMNGTQQAVSSNASIDYGTVSQATTIPPTMTVSPPPPALANQLQEVEGQLASVREQLRLAIAEERRIRDETPPYMATGAMVQLNQNVDHLRERQNELMQQRHALQNQILSHATWRYWTSGAIQIREPLPTIEGIDLSGPAPAPVAPNPADNPKELQRAYENTMVAQVVLDAKKRILITTKPVYIQKKTWKHKKKAGVYQIRIDFTQNTYDRTGVKIINTTRSHGGRHHPNIVDWICWGTMAADIEADFRNRNLLEVVNDCIDFIQSTNDEGGFDGKGWGEFFWESRRKATSFEDMEPGEVPF